MMQIYIYLFNLQHLSRKILHFHKKEDIKQIIFFQTINSLRYYLSKIKKDKTKLFDIKAMK